MSGSVELEVLGERWHLRRDHLMSVSSFIAAFKRRFGVTPARYAAQAAKSRNSPAHV